MIFISTPTQPSFHTVSPLLALSLECCPSVSALLVNALASFTEVIPGYISDRVGRKFGMMTATGIVAFFSLLSSASAGANHSVNGMLAMLITCR